MPPDVLSRYARGPHDEVIIDVTATRVEDLYHDFDKRADYIRRDLDPQLVEYLRLCAREIGSHPFAIRFTLEQAPDEEHQVRIRKSVPSYFRYLTDLERSEIRRMLLRSLLFLVVGLILVGLAVWVRVTLSAPPPGGQRSVPAEILGEGLLIASWVAMWEALAMFLLEWFPRRRVVNRLERLGAAPLSFTSVGELPQRG